MNISFYYLPGGQPEERLYRLRNRFVTRTLLINAGCCETRAAGILFRNAISCGPVAGQLAQRFDHYELVTGEDGKPVELGRGAVGVTYKALDINLCCPVTLKVISERYLGNLRRISLPKNKRVGRRCIPTASFVISCSSPGAFLDVQNYLDARKIFQSPKRGTKPSDPRSERPLPLGRIRRGHPKT
jgi:hypothetical protein